MRIGHGRAARAGTRLLPLLALLATAPLAPGAGGAATDNEVCLDCHADPDLEREEGGRVGTSVFVDAPRFAASIHEGMDCVDCHPDADVAADDLHAPSLQPAVCDSCHDDAAAEYAGSLHGVALARGDGDAPTCADCHGGHDVRAADDPESMVHRQRIATTCAVCHADPDFIQRRPVRINVPLEGYRSSVHFRGLMADGGGATCVDCHGAHELYRASDARSTIHRANTTTTCGRCHQQIATVYEASIHGQLVLHGNLDAPTCVDCHGEHEIRDKQDPQSSVYPAHITRTTCVRCHESERIAKRYGLPAGRLSSYLDSYHGLANRTGSTTVANCASCHGVHDIRPSSDPLSSVHKANLPQTCGQCHPGAGQNFAIGTIHAANGEGAHWLVDVVRRAYLWLIVAVIGAMALHNGVDFARRFRLPRLPYARDILRLTGWERLQHVILALAFMILAYSGFALKFPNAWWAAPFDWTASGEDSRRLVHRLAALAMLGVGLGHVGYLAWSRRGREQWHALRPGMRDLRDLWQMLRFYLGRAARRPAFARFSYVEKAEYWAVLWGSVVMTATGFALWFDDLSLRLLPKWVLDLATVVHYYEAWLATLAIIVWHFYWVIFNPQVYPMSLVWLTGFLSREAMAHEHPRELEALDRVDRRDGDAP